MTGRRSKRELERAVGELDSDGDDDLPDQYVIHRRVIDGDGAVVDTYEKVLDLGG